MGSGADGSGASASMFGNRAGAAGFGREAAFLAVGLDFEVRLLVAVLAGSRFEPAFFLADFLAIDFLAATFFATALPGLFLVAGFFIADAFLAPFFAVRGAWPPFFTGFFAADFFFAIARLQNDRFAMPTSTLSRQSNQRHRAEQSFAISADCAR